MKLISVDITEQRRYTFRELSNLFEIDHDATKTILKRLKEYNVLKSVRLSNEQKDLSDLIEEDIENVGVEENYYYVFTYVGILIISNLVLKCHPKYIKDQNYDYNEFKQVIKVIEKYNSKEQIIRLQNEIDEGSEVNMLPLIIYFIKDYYNNGLYNNSQKIIEINGDDEILWEKTINETFALIQNNQPYYLELYTKKTINDDLDYFKLLHEVILTNCSRDLENAFLLDLFDFPPIGLNNSSLDDFGDVEYILYRINQELNVQFNSHKQSLLKAMYAYMVRKYSYMDDEDYLSTYGTNSYNLIWEEMCCRVLDDKKNDLLIDLKLPLKLNSEYDENSTLLSIIEKPKWYGYEHPSGEFCKSASKSLEPDSITFFDNDGEFEFIIFDAKYYNLHLKKDSNLLNYPGIESVTKQYLYELSFKEFVKLHGFVDIKNCFLFPSNDDEILNIGYVKLKMLHDLSLRNIQIVLLPAKMINKFYLENMLLDITELNL